MKDNLNSFFATLIILVAGIGAAWLIYNLATKSTLPDRFGGAEAKYAPLQKSILGQ